MPTRYRSSSSRLEDSIGGLRVEADRLHGRERFVLAYTNCLEKAKYVILILYIFGALGAMYTASKLSSSVSKEMDPPIGSQSQRAYENFRMRFQSQADGTPIVLFATSLDRKAILQPEYIQFDSKLNQTLLSYGAEGDVSYSSFVSVVDAGLPIDIASQYLSQDNTSVMTTVVYKYASNDPRTGDFVKFVQDSVATLVPLLEGKIQVYVLGLNTFEVAIAGAATNDLLRMVAIVMPLCCFAFCWHMACLRYLIFPVLCLFFSTVFTMAALTGFAQVLSINAVVPGIALFLVLALVSNYSIFILNGYKKEARVKLRMLTSLDGEDSQLIVRRTLVTTGVNILISGMTLGLCSLGISAFPLEAVSSIGIGCLVAVLMSMCTTLVFIPTMLLAFPTFFSHGVRYTCMENMKILEDWCVSNSDAKEFAPLLSPDTPRSIKMSFYHKVGVFVTTKPFNFITCAVILALCAFPIWQAITIDYTNSISLYLPRDGGEVKGWNQLVTVFNPGEIYTYRLIMSLKNFTGTNGAGNCSLTDPVCGIFDPNNWAAAQNIINDIGTTVPHTVCRNLNSISFDGIQQCTWISTETVEYDVLCCSIGICLGPTLGRTCTKDILYKNILFSIFVPPTRDATWVLIKLSFDPTSNLGHAWYNTMKDKIENYTQTSPFNVGLSGYAAESIDTINFVQEYFPIMAGLTFCIIMVVLSFAYHSIATPMRCVLNVGVTILTVWGLTNSIYIHGYFDYFGVESLQTTGGIVWLAPFCALFICVRMCLDNDLVYFRYVSELHFEGNTVNEALRLGLAETSPGITAAGVIMALSFSGLIFSKMPMMNQLGCYLVTTALVETFVMRMFFVPAVLSIMGDWNWLPRSWTAARFHPTIRGVNAPNTEGLLPSLDDTPTSMAKKT